MSENGTSPKIAVCFDRKMMMNHEISRHPVFRQTQIKYLNQLRWNDILKFLAWNV